MLKYQLGVIKMYKPTKKIEQVIDIISSNFKESTNKIYDYQVLEKERINIIRICIIALVKLYKGKPLEEIEKEILKLYPIESNYQEEITKSIIEIAYNISYDIYIRANNVLLQEEKNDNKYHRSYIALFDSNGKQFFDITKFDENKGMYQKQINAADIYKDYPKKLKEYLNNLNQSLENKETPKVIVNKNGISIEPKINLDTKCFVKIRKKLFKFM